MCEFPYTATIITLKTGSQLPSIAVIGGGPAGLRAAEILSQSSCKVLLFDAKRSVGRKFLVAGKSGLNLTNAEDLGPFLTRYTGPAEFWAQALQQMSPEDLRQWALNLGIETFVSSGKKVFPEQMKAAPLLRRWVQRLKKQGVDFHMQHALSNFAPDKNRWKLTFTTPNQTPTNVHADAIILSMGGASWPQTGSTGDWSTLFKSSDSIEPFTAANCGWEVDWPDAFLNTAEGIPLKNISAKADHVGIRGELMVTRYGLEGGPLYRLGPVLRAQASPTLILDLKPGFSLHKVVARLGDIRKNYIREASRRLKLDPASTALLKYLPHLGPWNDVHTLAQAIKSCPVPLTKTRPIQEAISTAGGIRWQHLTNGLMLKKFPGIFCAGEMIDWEAPTGGYLLQGCFATGTVAAKSAQTWLKR